MAREIFEPDLICREDAPYWAAATVVAIRAGDAERAAKARENLLRLGYRLDVDRKAGERRRGGAARA